MTYKSLEIWKLSADLVTKIHAMTLNELPKFEMFEVGSQIRRSVKSIKSNIVEGYSRRSYKQEFIHFLVIAKGSVDETTDHLDTLLRTKSLKNVKLYQELIQDLNKLSGMIFNFIIAIKKDHRISG